MDKIVRSVAIYKALIDSSIVNDILDPFQRVVETEIFEDTKISITIEDITKSIESKTKIIIPDMPMRTILGRIVAKGALSRIKGNKRKFHVVDRNALKETAVSISEHKSKIERDFDYLVTDFASYVQANFGVKISTSDSINVIESFILEQATSITMNQNVVSEKTNIFFADYFLEKCVHDTVLSDILKTITFGHVLSESIFITSPNEKPKFSSMKVVLDTPILFKLLGINEVDEKEIYQTFVSSLQNSGAQVFTYNHCIEEMERIIDGSIFWIEKNLYDRMLASETSNFFVNNGYSIADMHLLRLTLRDQLKEKGINILVETYEASHHPFNQDETRIYETIVNFYCEDNPSFKIDEKRETIELDAKSINKTYILRMGSKPINLSNCSAIFVSDNSGLVYASKIYNDNLFPSNNLLSTCVMDIFLGTYLWLDSPLSIKELAFKQLISQAYSIMNPSDVMWKKYVGELEKCLKDNRVTPEQGYLLRSSTFVSRALVKLTLKDLSCVSYDTPLELLEKVKELGKKEAEEQYLKKTAEITTLKNEEIKTLEDIVKIRNEEVIVRDNKSRSLAEKEIKKYSILLKFAIALIMLIGYVVILLIFYDFDTMKLNMQCLLYLVPYTVFLLSLLIIRLKDKTNIYGFIYARITQKIRTYFEKKYIA
ncbi:MAG: hypothetical protein AB9921_00580 [Erysipelotrichaceae bacterium]